MDAMFELADTWTYGSNPELYAGFLTDLFNHIAIGAPPDAYFWKRDEDIAYGGFECGMEPALNRVEKMEAVVPTRTRRKSLPPLTKLVRCHAPSATAAPSLLPPARSLRCPTPPSPPHKRAV